MFRKALVIASIALCVVIAKADDSRQSIISHIMAGGTITVNQPAALDSLIARPAVAIADGASATESRPSEASSTRSGYRVQLFEDNNPRSARSQAENYHRRVQAEFPQLRSYISFNTPYWRLKAGDFRTRAEAESVLSELKQAYPAIAPYMRVVRDKINITE